MPTKTKGSRSARKKTGPSARPARRAGRAGAKAGRPAPRAPAKAKGRAKAAAKAAAPAQRPVRQGFISHTELASSDPEATKAWCEAVLGWKFGPSMPTPQGPYHVWDFGDRVGGGIRRNNPPEAPGSIPYCEVKDLRAAFAKACQAGATPMMPPTDIPGSGGAIAIVAAPGGPAVGFWGKL